MEMVSHFQHYACPNYLLALRVGEDIVLIGKGVYIKQAGQNAVVPNSTFQLCLDQILSAEDIAAHDLHARSGTLWSPTIHYTMLAFKQEILKHTAQDTPPDQIEMVPYHVKKRSYSEPQGEGKRSQAEEPMHWGIAANKQEAQQSLSKKQKMLSPGTEGWKEDST